LPTNPRQRRQLSAAQQSQQNRFRLVVRLMREQHTSRAKSLHKIDEKSLANQAQSRCAVRLRLIKSGIKLASFSDFKMQFELPGKRSNELRIRIAFRAAQLVIDMGNNRRDVSTMLRDQSKQRNAVGSAAHAEDPCARFDCFEMPCKLIHPKPPGSPQADRPVSVRHQAKRDASLQCRCGR